MRWVVRYIFLCNASLLFSEIVGFNVLARCPSHLPLSILAASIISPAWCRPDFGFLLLGFTPINPHRGMQSCSSTSQRLTGHIRLIFMPRHAASPRSVTAANIVRCPRSSAMISLGQPSDAFSGSEPEDCRRPIDRRSRMQHRFMNASAMKTNSVECRRSRIRSTLRPCSEKEMGGQGC